MRPCWYPQGVLLFEPPLSFASAVLIRTLLHDPDGLTLLYAGDRMWPSVRHGARVRLRRRDAAAIGPGEIVVAEIDGIPELLRVTSVGEEGLVLEADADPDRRLVARPERLLGAADGPARRVSVAARRLRRAILEVREALGRGPEAESGGGESVRDKYDSQAVYYKLGLDQDLHRSLHARLGAAIPPGGRILVAGSGVGTECFALARAGWKVEGVDFAPGMIEVARKEARERGLDIPFHLADLHSYGREPRSLDGVLFTYDVYSFIPDPHRRMDLLRRMAGWLAPGGVVFLSARTIAGAWERLMLTLSWIGGGRRPERLWGASHSRWIDRDGSMRRAFLRKFTVGRIRKEAAAAGLQLGAWEAGHFQLAAKARRGG